MKKLILGLIAVSSTIAMATPPFIVETTDTFIDNDKVNKEWKEVSKSVAAVFYDQKVVKEGMDDLSNIMHYPGSDTYIIPMIPSLGEMLKMQYQKPACSTMKFKDELNPALCTAFLIEKDKVMTAGHCVPDFQVNTTTDGPALHSYIKNTKTNPEIDMIFYFSQGRKFKKYQKLEKELTYKGTELVEFVHAFNDDFAIIKLDRPVEGIKPLKVNFDYAAHAGDELRVIGHPIGLPLVQSTHGVIRDMDYIDQRFQIDSSNSSFGGNSGSPVFLESTKEVIGILVSGPSREAEDFTVTDRGCVDYTILSKEEGANESGVTLISKIDDYAQNEEVLLVDAVLADFVNKATFGSTSLEALLDGKDFRELDTQYQLVSLAIEATQGTQGEALKFMLPNIYELGFKDIMMVKKLALIGNPTAYNILKDRFQESFKDFNLEQKYIQTPFGLIPAPKPEL